MLTEIKLMLTVCATGHFATFSGSPRPAGFSAPSSPPGPPSSPSGPPSIHPGPPSFHRPASVRTEESRMDDLPRPDIRSLHIQSDIQLRYAKTLVSSTVKNPSNQSQEVSFSVVLPEKAFISHFLIEIDGQVYEAYVKEKEEAKRDYEAAVTAGQTAGHVEVSARDSNIYKASVNIEAEGKVTFNLTYEELLIRRAGRYEHTINIDPGQLVRHLTVDINIRESRNISFLRVPELRTKDIIKPNETENSLAVIQRTSPTEAYIRYHPTLRQQKKSSKQGLHGQFVVQYDVERELDAGDVLVVNGYFVHFFAPVDLPPLPKHVVFVLDTSGSMSGRKLQQTKSAMKTILDDLNSEDVFNIVKFSSTVQDWSPPLENIDDKDRNRTLLAYPVTEHYIRSAKRYILNLPASGATDINLALQRALALTLAMRGQLQEREPIIIFLTDGEPTSGITDLDLITQLVTEKNREAETAIFCLAFGTGADFNFLKKISLKNNGFARKIYEASDAKLQLEGFYGEIATPLLSNVTVTYAEDMLDENSLTDNKFHTFFKGSEFVVAGKTKEKDVADFQTEVTGLSAKGPFRRNDVVICPPFIYPPYPTVDPFPTSTPEPARNVTSMENFVERLWAYMTIKELLKLDDTAEESATTPPPVPPTTMLPPNITTLNETGMQTLDYTSMNFTEVDQQLPLKLNSTDVNITEGMGQEAPPTLSPREQALQLSLKYGFVTPVTSLVVVKPNDTSETETKSIDPHEKHESASGGRVGKMYLTPPTGPPPISPRISGQPQTPGVHTTNYVVMGLPSPNNRPSGAPRGPPGRPGGLYGGLRTKQYSLQELSWFGILVNETGITLPHNFSHTTFMKISTTMPDYAFQDCMMPFGYNGVCRHLVYCIQPDFLTDYQHYLQLHCEITGGFAGVCCPLDWNIGLYP